MFRVSFIVDDKHIHKVIHETASYAMNLEIKPVVNAVVAKTKGKAAPRVEAKTDASTTYMRVFENIKLSKVKGDRVTSAEIQEAMKAEKVSDNTYSFIIRNLKDHHLIAAVQRGIFVMKGE